MSSSTSTQLSFSLRTSANVKTVHLIGNWDGYKGQLPLARDASSSKAGAWKGTFRFSSKVMGVGRYWYYYIMDGYHVSHDPAQPSTTEPTTGRQLNILDVPATGSSSSSKPSSSKSSSSNSKSSSASSSHRTTPSSTSSRSNSSTSNSSRSSSNSSSSSRSSNSSSSTSRSSSSTTKSSSSSSNPIKGRPVSPSRIAHPRPVHPSSTTQQRLQSAQYAKQVAHLSRKLAKTKVSRGAFGSEDGSGSEFEEERMAALSNFSSDEDSGSEDDSDISDSLPSLGGSSRTSACSSPSSRTLSGFSYAEVKPAFTHAHSHGRSGSTSSSSSVCSCDRWGITRKGDRVRLDCGGSRCGSASPGYSSGSSDEGERKYAVAYPTGMTGFGEGAYKYAGGLEGCSSSDDSESDGEEYKVRVQPTVGVRRNGVVVRGGSRR